MLKIGITGGIGCGKSTVLAEFAKWGVPCFEADAVAGRYYEDADFCRSVAEQLGEPQVLLLDGHIDKRALAAIVFNNPDRLRQLNEIIHPRVWSDFEQLVSTMEGNTSQHPSPYILFESAILCDAGFDHRMDKVVCVYLDIEERIRRLILRDHTSREQILARMRNQLPPEQLLERADYILLNYEGNPRPRQVASLHAALLNRRSATSWS